MILANFEIPFWYPSPISLGPMDLHPFGLLVATGVMFGAYMMGRFGDKYRLSQEHIQGLVWYCVGIGFIGAHVFDVLAYQPGKLSEDPLLLFKVWQGISSYGGFIGGVVGFVIYVWKYKIDTSLYADASLWAFIPGFMFGRMGCTVAHDHIGAHTEDFFLATEYTTEVIRRYGFGSPPGGLEPGLHHNLGFYELLFMIVLFATMLAVERWPRRSAERPRARPDGFIAALMGTMYAPVRFIMEFLRDNPDADPRYVGLTFAQWMSFVLFLVGIYALVRLVKRPYVEPAVASEDGSGKSASKSAGKSGKKSGIDKGGQKNDSKSSAGKKAANKNKSGKRRKKK